MNRQKNIAIISAELTTENHAGNLNRTDRLRGLLNRLHYSNGLFSGYTPARRFYNGTFEDVFIIALKDGQYKQELNKIKQIAEDFGQEAIIHSDSNRHAELLFANGFGAESPITESLGKLVGVSQEEAESFGSYITRDVKHKGTVTSTYYYVTKKVQ